MEVVNETYGQPSARSHQGGGDEAESEGMNVFFDLGDATELPGMVLEDEESEPEKPDLQASFLDNFIYASD